MTREQMIVYMGLLDEKYIAEADPTNAKNIKRKKQRGTVLRFGSIAACLILIVGAMFYLNRESEYTKPPRTIIKTYGYLEPMGMQIADVNHYEAVTELSSQIVLCSVSNLVEVTVTETGSFSFCYEIEILDTLLDIGSRLQIGDTIKITSSEGILKATEAAALVADTAQAKKFGILQGEYAEDEYIASSTWNAIPIEVGHNYLMYLNDAYLEKEGVYAESGRSYLYEYHGQTVYSGRDMIKNEQSLKEILKTVSHYITLRTGRADEIGDDAYILELGEQQKNNLPPQETDNADTAVSPPPAENENNNTSIHQLFVLNEVTDVLGAAPKYRDPALHYKETWDVDTMAEYLGIDLYSILEAFSQKHGMMMFNIGKKQFGVTFENSGQIVEDMSSYRNINDPDKDHSGIMIIASKLRPPCDCIYETETEITTTIPIDDSGETLDLMIYVYRDAVSPDNPPKYIADFQYNDVFYRIDAIDISIEQLAELIAQIVHA